MKRIAVTTFALLYAITLICGAVDRTSTWSAKLATDTATSRSKSSSSEPSVHRTQDFEPHHPSRRILEEPFLAGAPALVSEIALAATEHAQLPLPLTVPKPATRQIGSRAPPFRS